MKEINDELDVFEDETEEALFFAEEDVDFDPEDHRYTGTVSGKEYTSATTLLRKFGMTPSEYDIIPKEILEAKAKYGTAVHKALEDFILGDETQLLVPEVASFNEWLIENKVTTLDCVAEQKVFNEYYGIAGTVDLQLWNVIADFKTTATLHMVPVMWQLSLYNFLLHPDEVDYNMHELKVFWFASDGVLTVRPVPLIPYNRLVSLIEAHQRGDEVWIDESVPTEMIDKVDSIIKQKKLIDTLKRNLKVLESEQEVIKVALQDQMKEDERMYVDTETGTITLTEVSVARYDTSLVTAYINSKGDKPAEYKKVSTHIRMNIKDKTK